jgi:ankyrin repeat protein
MQGAARSAMAGPMDLVAALALGDWRTAERLLRDRATPSYDGALHLLAKRGDAAAVRWLLDRGADPDARWSHWDAEVTPLHLAVLGGHASVVSVLLDAGADPRIRDSKHDADAAGWGEFFRAGEILEILRARS